VHVQLKRISLISFGKLQVKKATPSFPPNSCQTIPTGGLPLVIGILRPHPLICSLTNYSVPRNTLWPYELVHGTKCPVTLHISARHDHIAQLNCYLPQKERSPQEIPLRRFYGYLYVRIPHRCLTYVCIKRRVDVVTKAFHTVYLCRHTYPDSLDMSKYHCYM